MSGRAPTRLLVLPGVRGRIRGPNFRAAPSRVPPELTSGQPHSLGQEGKLDGFGTFLGLRVQLCGAVGSRGEIQDPAEVPNGRGEGRRGSRSQVMWGAGLPGALD